MNRTLNIRIVELLTKEKRSSFNYLYVLTNTSNNLNPIEKMKITPNKSGNILICEKSVSIKIDSQLENFIYLDFKRNRFLINDDILGKLALPLEWFPSNHVVREWFPIKKNRNEQCDTMILLDVHIDCRGAAPFMAPIAPLKVIPSWKRPSLDENAEVLVNQHYVHNIPNNSYYAPQVQQHNLPVSNYYPTYQIQDNQQMVFQPYQVYQNQYQHLIPLHQQLPNQQQQQNQYQNVQYKPNQSFQQQQIIYQPNLDIQNQQHQDKSQSSVYYPHIPLISNIYNDNQKTNAYY